MGVRCPSDHENKRTMSIQGLFSVILGKKAPDLDQQIQKEQQISTVFSKDNGSKA